ncbi:MAG: hypothetical protein LIP01_15745 [Tannerellaceae bacterium]|nr:hypothetical protein [Tannerellaceae bacterium]
MLCFVTLFFVGCGDGKVTLEGITNPHNAVHDPSQPIVVTKFSPKEGGVGTPILIEGSNFGSDLSIIHVSIEGQTLPTVGCDGTRLYETLTEPLNDTDEGHPILIRIGVEGKEKEEFTTEKFKYVITPFVSTIAGYKDERNESFSRDGVINEAQFGNINWIEFDQDKNLYILEEGGGMRFIDKDLTYVDTKFTVSNGIDRVRTLSFTNDWSKMYITNDDDNDQWQGAGTIELSAADGFKEWKRIINSRFCNGGAIHPVDGSYFFGSYEQGQIFKWSGFSDPMSAKENSEELFKIQDKDWEFNIRFHPSGDYAYLVVINRHYILKSYYNWEEKN